MFQFMPTSHTLWNLRAMSQVIQNDRNGDGKLNRAEYNDVSLVKGDGYFAGVARDFEFAVVDEIKLSDNQVSAGELAQYYQSMDLNKNGEHSKEEFSARLNQASWRTRFYHPIAAFTNVVSHYTNLVSSLGQ